MAKNEELVGIFHRERNCFQDNTTDRVVIAELESGTVIKGRAAKNELQWGMTYRFLGHWTTHDKYGKQFVFNSFCLAEPASERGIVSYLARAPHIGRRRARQIFDLFGPEAVRIAREEPTRIAAEIRGVSAGMAEEMAEWLAANRRLEGVTIELSDLLTGRGFPKTLAKRVIGRWGEEAPAIIRENPYRLMQFGGVGFSLADRLYMELGLPADAIQRQALAAWHALAGDSEGNTWQPAPVCIASIRKHIAGANLDVAAALSFGKENDILRARENCSTTYYADASRADSESKLAGYIAAALCEVDDSWGFPDYSRLRWPDLSSLKGPSPHQLEQLYKATRGVVGILTGSPGTGKTTTLAALIKAIKSSRGHGEIAVCAPTGKAAVRITESLAAHGLAIKATTIHRLLVVMSGDGDEGGWRFKFGEREKLPHQFIFVDEGSMPDVDLYRALFAARPRGCHVLIVGDPHQLPPVGHGAPFRDLIAAGLPSGHLTEIHRNAGRIVRCCQTIRESQSFVAGKELDLDAGENLVVVPARTPEEQVEAIIREVQRAADAGMDPIWDVQIVVPLNDSGPVCRKVLNEKLQGWLNPNGKRVEGNRFRVGDKIVCGKNSRVPAHKGGHAGSYDSGEWDCPSSEIDDEGKCYVANGEQARVLWVEDNRTIAELDSPRRVVVIPKGRPQAEGESGERKSEGSAGDWDLAFAISVHKSQGSQWKVVIVVIDESGGAKWVCNREWVTTAISRAEKWCACVGKRETINGYVRRTGLWKRKTFLCEKVDELLREASGDVETEPSETNDLPAGFFHPGGHAGESPVELPGDPLDIGAASRAD